MDYQESIQLFFKNYTNFQGRARRAEYWWPVVMYLVAYIAVVVLSIALSVLGDIGGVISGLIFIVCLLFCLGCFIPSLSVAVRRLHDKNMTGWFLLIGLIPFLGSLVLLYFFATEGTQGPNQYGEDPKGGPTDVF